MEKLSDLLSHISRLPERHFLAQPREHSGEFICIIFLHSRKCTLHRKLIARTHYTLIQARGKEFFSLEIITLRSPCS
jgi:hypothetical protein